jgi:hypothetical protein
MKVLVVGGGIFGCSVAIELARSGFETTLIEKSGAILSKATKNNHNRIHYGYHYPRSIETASQSMDGLVSFLMAYKDAVITDFPNYYAIAKEHSRIQPEKYESFCDRVGISYHREYPASSDLNPDMILSSLRVEEPIYDWNILYNIIQRDLIKTGVKVELNTPFSLGHMSYDFIINCSYSGINQVNQIAGVPKFNFRSQDVIIPTFKWNRDRIGLTVMDGPFCSIMPKGAEENRFLLYHAKYSVITESINQRVEFSSDIDENLRLIKEDAARYFPAISGVEFEENWRAIRSIPVSANDERLSRIITYVDNPNFITVFSGKVSTCIKIAKQIKHGLHTGDFNNNMTV